MRVLLALGGNAMTNADGRARPEDQIAAAQVAMAASPSCSPRRRRRGHPRQRPAGRQPAGQERARRGRRTAGAAGLVRRPDPGDPRLRADGRARRRARPRGRRPALRHRRDPHPGRRRTTRASPTRPSRSAASCRPTRRPLLVEHGETWEDRGEQGLAPRRRLARSRSRSSTPPAVHALVEAGFVVVANGGGGIPVVRDDGRACAASRPSSTRTSAPRCSARTVGADVLVVATDVPHAVLRFGTPEAEPLGRVDVARMRALRRRGPLRQRLDGPQGRRGLPVRRAGRHPRRDHQPGPHRRRGRRRRPARSSSPTDGRARPRTEQPSDACPAPSRSARSRSTPSSDASELARLIDDGVIDADRVVAIIGKTEGNGGVNDYTRIIADRAFREVLVAKGAAAPSRSSRSRSSGPAAPTG